MVLDRRIVLVLAALGLMAAPGMAAPPSSPKREPILKQSTLNGTEKNATSSKDKGIVLTAIRGTGAPVNHAIRVDTLAANDRGAERSAAAIAMFDVLGVPRENVFTLDPRALDTGLAAALITLARKAQGDETLYVFLSGHFYRSASKKPEECASYLTTRAGRAIALSEIAEPLSHAVGPAKHTTFIIEMEHERGRNKTLPRSTCRTAFEDDTELRADFPIDESGVTAIIYDGRRSEHMRSSGVSDLIIWCAKHSKENLSACVEADPAVRTLRRR